MKLIYIFLFLLCPLVLLIYPASAKADVDTTKIKEVILVRGSDMTMCPYNDYSDTDKARINDSQPYYSLEEYFHFHPNPQLSSGSNCKHLLYGQLELVPFGQDPTYVPTEYMYSIDSLVIRENKVYLSVPQQFSDNKMTYKKVTSFTTTDANTGQQVTLANTLFWFRGTTVYGRIGDISDGIVEYQGQYYRIDGEQTFLNHVVIWQNPNPAPSTMPSYTPEPTPLTIMVPMSPAPVPTFYQNGISWRQVPYGTTVNGMLYPSDLPSFFNPPGRLIGYVLQLPDSTSSTQGLVATLKSCKDNSCQEEGFREIMFVTDDQGRRLDQTMYTTKVDLNTDYMRTYRKVYLLVGSMDAPNPDGSPFKFYFGPEQ